MLLFSLLQRKWRRSVDGFSTAGPTKIIGWHIPLIRIALSVYRVFRFLNGVIVKIEVFASSVTKFEQRWTSNAKWPGTENSHRLHQASLETHRIRDHRIFTIMRICNETAKYCLLYKYKIWKYGWQYYEILPNINYYINI